MAMYDDIQISSEFELQYMYLLFLLLSLLRTRRQDMYENESHSQIVEVVIVAVSVKRKALPSTNSPQPKRDRREWSQAEELLLDDAIRECHHLRKNQGRATVNELDEDDENYWDNLVHVKRRSVDAGFIDCRFIRPTSNICERFFSKAKRAAAKRDNLQSIIL